MSDTGRDAAAPSPSPSTNDQKQQHHHLLQQQQTQQPSTPSFEPLFAIINNATTNATSHPRVRYLFTDDDPSIIHEHQQHQHQHQHQQQQLPHDPPPHRNIVVDLIPDTSTPSAAANVAPSAESDAASIGTNAAAGGGAWRVGWASSLDPDFAVTSSAVTLQQGEEGDGATMLTIEGVEREPVDVSGGPLAVATAASSPAVPGGSAAAAGAGESGALKGSGSGSGSGASGHHAVPREDVEGLVDDFKRRMGILGKVVAEGERRRAAVGHRDDDRAEQQQETPGGGGGGGAEPGFDPKTIERPASKASVSQR